MLLRELAIVVVALVSGVFAGIWSARISADSTALAGVVHAGAWRAWPRAGVADALPYARLRHYLDATLPPSPMDRLELVADTDDEGHPLSARCIYRLTGHMLPVRYWILSVHDPATRTRSLATLQAADVVYEPNGDLHIMLAPRIQPGNWLQTTHQGAMRLVMHLFGVNPLRREKVLASGLLRITRVDCP